MKLYTINEIAKLFKVSRQTVNNWISQGKINTIKIGRTIRINQSEIDKILKQQ